MPFLDSVSLLERRAARLAAERKFEAALHDKTLR